MKEMEGPGYIKFADRISKAEFVQLFINREKLRNWFTDAEISAFSFPRNSGSLGARYLVKKRICEQLGGASYQKEIEILNETNGKPVIRFGREIRAALKKSGISQVMISVSHSRNFIATLTIFCL